MLHAYHGKALQRKQWFLLIFYQQNKVQCRLKEWSECLHNDILMNMQIKNARGICQQ